MNSQVAAVGAGVVGPAGTTVDGLRVVLQRAAGTLAELVTYPSAGADVTFLACSASDFEPENHFAPHELRRMDRAHQLAIVAADAALASCGPSPEPDRCAIVIGSGLGAPGYLQGQIAAFTLRGPRAISPMAIPIAMANSVAGNLAIRYGFRGPANTINMACASGSAAIGEAMWLLRTGRADRVLAGGVEAPITAGSAASFARMEAMSARLADPAAASRPFDRGRDGLVLGEGAAFVVLERAAPGAEVVGHVLGYMANSDAHHMVAPRPDGGAAAACMRGALADAALAADAIGHVNAHGTSTRLNDEAEASALRMVFGSRPVPVTANKGVLGHLIGAAGAMEAIATWAALRAGVVPPIANLAASDVDLNALSEPAPTDSPYALSNSFGFGGHNATLVLG
jgi:3-oxoacyl-[acyl-carrier-protein] synthase II